MLTHVYLFLLCSTSLSPWITITKPSHSAFVLKVRWTRTVSYGFSSSYATSAFDLIVRTLCLHLLTVKMNPSPVCIVRLNFPFPSRSQLCLKVHPFGNLLFLFPSSFFEFLLLCFSFPVGDPRSQGIIVSCTIDYMSCREERLRAPILRLWAFVFVHAHIFAQVVLNSRVLSFHCSVVVPHCWVSSFFFLFGIVGFISEDNMKPPQSIFKKNPKSTIACLFKACCYCAIFITAATPLSTCTSWIQLVQLYSLRRRCPRLWKGVRKQFCTQIILIFF